MSKRVEIIREYGRPPKKRRFGYVISVNTTGGMHMGDRAEDWNSKPGEPAFLVSRTADGRSGASWYSADGIRFTKAPTADIAGLSDDERVALDLVLEGENYELLTKLVPTSARRGVIKTIAAQLKSMRSR